MIDWFYLAIYNIFGFLAKTLPQTLIDNIISLLANFAYFASPKRRRVIEANLDICFANLSKKEKKDIAIYSYKNLLYSILSFVKEDKQKILEEIEYDGCEEAKRLIDSGKKVIFFTAHFGVWELLPYIVIDHFKVDFAIVGRELDSKLMQKRLKEAREKAGVELINKKGAMKGMIKALNSGKTLGLLIDQSLPKSKGGEDVEFCGKIATQSSAASILAYKFDAVLIPMFITSDNFSKHKAICLDPITPNKNLAKDEEIKRLNQAQADAIVKMIKAYPKEWFWSHKRFKVYDNDIYK